MEGQRGKVNLDANVVLLVVAVLDHEGRDCLAAAVHHSDRLLEQSVYRG